MVLSRIASNIFSSRLCSGRTRSRSAPGSKSGQHFDDGDARAQRRIDRAEFEADISSADDQQASGNVFQIQRAGGIHHARRIELECWERSPGASRWRG